MNAGVGDRKSLDDIRSGEAGKGLFMFGDGEGELPPNDIDELNDWSTSIGKSISVRVGEGAGEEKRVDGKDSTSGEEEKQSMLGDFVAGREFVMGREIYSLQLQNC